MNKKTKTIVGLAIIAGVGYYLWKQNKDKSKKQYVGADNFFKSHSQNCSGLNCV